MTESELLTHAELQASVWTDVMIALRRLVPPAEFITITAGDKPIFAGDVLTRERVVPQGSRDLPMLPVTSAALRRQLDKLKALHNAAPRAATRKQLNHLESLLRAAHRSKPLPTSSAAKTAKPAAPKKPAAPVVDRKKRDLLDWAAREQTVIVVLRSAKGPLKTAEVAAKARLTDYATKETLRRLVKAGRVLHTGATSTSRWAPCTWSMTGVTRQPPPAPARTATSPAAITDPVSGQQFERVKWDGKDGLTSVGRS